MLTIAKFSHALLFLHICTASDNKLSYNTDFTAGIVDDVNFANKYKQNVLTSHDVNTNKSLNEIVLTTVAPTAVQDNHVCTKEEEYVEEIRTPSMEPVRIRSSAWCLEFPPRCSNYKTEMREVIKTENITKTRTIRFCCAGYEGNISINDTVCKAVCRGGCGRGFCLKPDTCSCEPGYMGKHCTLRCDHDHWGLNCKNECRCHNGAVCDNKSGLCHCTIGWTGEFCEQPCPSGTHGVMCRKSCECDNKRCHPQTGVCDNAFNSLNSSNVTHVMIASLNSTIANITHNLDRLAKNIDNIASSSTTEKFLHDYEWNSSKPALAPEVIVIKQDESQHAPKIIVHQPGQGLLENLHNAVKSPDVIHVITNGLGEAHNMSQENTLQMAGFATIPEQKEDHLKVIVPHTPEHESNVLTTILVILLVIMVAIAMGFLYVYRRYHLQKAQVEAALAARSVSLVPGVNTPVIITSPPPMSAQHDITLSGFQEMPGSLGKSFLKPLPDLPAFTQMVRNKIEGPDLYDAPLSNACINTSTPTAYRRKESLYSVVTPKSRKPSMDSHLYDEIPYSTALTAMTTTTNVLNPMPTDLITPNYLRSQNHQPPLQRQVSNHHQPQQQQPQQHHASQLFIPVQSGTFSQRNPPHLLQSLTKIAHI
uniref:EMI domain-containing protein n=1 Tax=Glossina brevipalpis TaxID=37001 RepID=A0A1A9WU31_9MUSC